MMERYVHIVESPSHSDLLNGRTEGQLLRETLRLASIPHRYYLATSLETFKESLGIRLRQDVTDLQRRLPILHLSMHGNEDGVKLTDQFLTWENLREELDFITNAMQGELLVVCRHAMVAPGVRWQCMKIKSILLGL